MDRRTLLLAAPALALLPSALAHASTPPQVLIRLNVFDLDSGIVWWRDNSSLRLISFRHFGRDARRGAHVMYSTSAGDTGGYIDLGVMQPYDIFEFEFNDWGYKWGVYADAQGYPPMRSRFMRRGSACSKNAAIDERNYFSFTPKETG